MLDFATCTECGRCQSQCPAWNTEKPLSPKLLIMNLRDHAMAKAPYLLADPTDRDGLPDAVKAEAEPASWSARPRATRRCRPAARSSTPTCCGRASPAAPASSSARSTSSTSTTSSTCAATRCWSSPNFPVRAQRALQGPGEQGQPVEHVAQRADGLGQGPAVRGQAGRRATSRTSTRSTGCSGSAAPAPTRTARRRPPARSPSCSTWPASRSRCSATARPAPATRPAAPATSSSSSSSRCRTPRCSRRPRSRRSSPPARTASTP